MSSTVRPSASWRMLSWAMWGAMVLGLGTSGLVPAADQDDPVRIAVSYAAPSAGFVSLAMFDQQGTLVRSLLSSAPVVAGSHEVFWDATSDLGLPVPPGTYRTKAIFFPQPPSLKWVMKVGKSGQPPWRTADGKGDWGGNLGGPAGICADDKRVIVAWSCVEDNQITGIQQINADGMTEMRYFSFYPWDIRMAAAMDGSNYFLGILHKLRDIEIAVYTIGQPRGRILCRLPCPPVKVTSGRWRGRDINNLDGLAITADRVYASVSLANSVFIIDRSTGRILRTIPVPRPCGLTVLKGRLLVASGDHVLALSLTGDALGDAVPSGIMTAPNALCAGKDGTLYVGDSGRFDPDPEVVSGSQQVYVFGADGRLLRTLGRRGGCPRQGAYRPDGFGDIAGMCMGPGGDTLFVNDNADGFVRTSRWSLQGALQKTWFSTTINGNQPDHVDPSHPDELIRVGGALGDNLGVQAWHMDIPSKSWSPAWHYTMPFANCWQKAVRGYDHGGCPLHDDKGRPLPWWPLFGYGDGGGLVTFRGRRYMLSNEGAIYSYGPDGPPRLMAMVCPHRCEIKGGRILTYYDQGPNNWFTWADQDGSGQVGVADVSLSKDPPALAGIRRLNPCLLDPSMAIYFQGIRAAPDPITRQLTVLCRLPLSKMLPDGAPLYDWKDLKVVTPAPAYPSFAGGDGTKTVGIVEPSNLEVGTNSYYLIDAPASVQRLRLPGIDGEGWWASRNWRKKICCFDRTTGACRWAVGRRAPGVAEPGQMYNPLTLAGVADHAVFAADALAVVWVWDTDGLYLGNLYNPPSDKKMDQYSMYIELQGASLLSTGGRLYLIGSDCGAAINEIRMPIRTTLAPVEVSVDAATVAKARPWDPDGLPPGQKPVYEVHDRDRHPGLWPMKIDGVLDGREGWGGFPDHTPVGTMQVLMDGEQVATVQAMRDGDDLYLGYRVRAPNGPINTGSELPTCPFVSGAYVDASFAPDWQTLSAMMSGTAMCA